MRILAIDQGTSGTKALVICQERGVLARAEEPVRPRFDGALVEHDPEALWASVVISGRRALADAGVRVDAMALANQGETVLAWDRATGTPLTPAIVWQDRRSASVCERLSAEADRLAALTGLELDPYFAAPKMTWLRENLTTEGVVTTTDTWLIHRLTGAFVTDAATASRTLLLDLDEVRWSDEARSIFGLEAEEWPEIVDCAGRVGETRAFGDYPIPVTGLVVDQQAALYGQDCLEVGAAKCTFGTGAFLLANTGSSAPRSRSGLTTSVAWRLAGVPTYCLDGQVYTVGSAVSWLTDLGVIASAADLDALGSTVPDAGGAVIVPALTGLAAPWWRGDARCAMHGLGLGTTRAHLVRAMVDGIAAQLAELTATVAADLGGELGHLRVDGGLTRSTVLMQTLADLAQLPIDVHGSPDATALGAGAFAALGAGAGDDRAPTPASTVRYEPGITPDQAGDRMDRFRAVVAAVLEEAS